MMQETGQSQKEAVGTGDSLPALEIRKQRKTVADTDGNAADQLTVIVQHMAQIHHQKRLQTIQNDDQNANRSSQNTPCIGTAQIARTMLSDVRMKELFPDHQTPGNRTGQISKYDPEKLFHNVIPIVSNLYQDYNTVSILCYNFKGYDTEIRRQQHRDTGRT